ncbi:hypothetical protein B0I37DRAFT_86961 [Chaetomium sp. MPI-CAGE-AT-0009]|nr:hypothetical protein B0I37DRAFT_86961 [Chaetomium sp. MPI-CAGE-AT-0009]
MVERKWRERLRRTRNRLFHGRRQRLTKDNPTSAPFGPPLLQAAGSANDQTTPVVQIGPNPPSYYYPPFRLQYNLRGHHSPNHSTFDLTLPIPPSGISQHYPRRSSPKRWPLRSLSLKGSSLKSSLKSPFPKSSSTKISSPNSSTPKSFSPGRSPMNTASPKTSSSPKTSTSDPQTDQPKPKRPRPLSSPVSTKTQRGSLHSSRWSFGSNRAVRAARLDISHFAADNSGPSLPSGMMAPTAPAGPAAPVTPPDSRRPPSFSGRGPFLPTPPPTPPLSPSE